MDLHKKKPSILIVDDEVNFRESLVMALEGEYFVETAGSMEEAIHVLKSADPDVVLLDISLPDGSGIDLIPELRASRTPPVVAVMTAYATVENAVKALKEGAADYVVKPFEIEKLKRELGVHLENRSLHLKVSALDREISKLSPPFVTAGIGKMKEIVDKVPMIAPLDIPVLIMGETGTGKERLAQWIHSLSCLGGEMVAINCAALPRDIFESELFGYVKGAFTGAVAHKEGLIEKAEGGTLFLDEIGELSQAVQAKFLRVLDDGVYYKIGDTRERRANFRLVTATNRDLADASSTFRKDLYYRIHGVSFTLPTLRERRDDIPLLIAAFLERANYIYKKQVKALSPGSVQRLLSYDWPGNIRELMWCINRAVAMADGDVADIGPVSIASAHDKPHVMDEIDFSIPFADALERVEKNYITRALAATGNNKTGAAKLLEISVRTLHYKMEKYGL
jgi:DNA-binding NtrC family response regulator